MAEQSLLTDEIRAFIGRATPDRPVRITEEGVRRSIAVYGGDASTPLAEGEIVPGYVLMGLSPDGEGDPLRLPDPLPRSILVSNEFSIERPIRLGESLNARSRIADITERLGGQFGHGIYARSEVEFRDGSGAVVGRTASTMMYYDPAGARRGEGEE